MRFCLLYLPPILILSVFISGVTLAQSHSSDITTIVLIRHAETIDKSEDPDLSLDGYERVERLTQMFYEVDVDAIYSTNFNRTKETVRKIAESRGLEIQIYDYQTPEETIKKWLEEHRGDTILISGHSNTTPTFTNAILGREYFTSSFDESDYGNLLIVTISGSGDSKLLHLRY